MDLFIALSVIVWAGGGAFSAAWIFWLDRERRELALPLKLATLGGWPILLPFLLYQREDLALWQAGRNVLVGLMILGGPSMWGAIQALSVDPRRADRWVATLDTFVEPVRLASPVLPRGDTISRRDTGSPTEQDRREAILHWNSGIICYQKGDYEKARDEWRRCKRLDPSNSDCITGLQRIDQSYGH